MRALFLLLGVWFAGCSTINLGAALGDASAEPPGLPLDLLWERDADGAFGPSAAHVTDRFVVVGTRKGDVVVIDRDTGRIEGAGEFGDSVEGQLAVSPNGEVLYVPTVGGGGGVEAYDVRRGRRIWRWRAITISSRRRISPPWRRKAVWRQLFRPRIFPPFRLF